MTTNDFYQKLLNYEFEMIMSTVISHISDLTGDDFEIYNRIQIFKSGYILLETDEKDIDKLVISGLYNFINRRTEDNLGKTLPPFICGIANFRNGLTDEIHYSSRQNIEVHLQSINLFRNCNAARKYYDLNPIPFIPRIKNKEAIHVNFIDIVSNFRDISDTNKCCEDALTDLMHYLQLVDVVKELGIKCKWVETKMKKPIYC